MTKTTHKNVWFRATRGSYLPASPMGLAIYLLYVTYIVALVGGWFWRGYQLWDLLAFVIPLSVAAALVAHYIAARHTR